MVIAGPYLRLTWRFLGPVVRGEDVAKEAQPGWNATVRLGLVTSSLATYSSPAQPCNTEQVGGLLDGQVVIDQVGQDADPSIPSTRKLTVSPMQEDRQGHWT
jgi:hypothetical protein